MTRTFKVVFVFRSSQEVMNEVLTWMNKEGITIMTKRDDFVEGVMENSGGTNHFAISVKPTKDGTTVDTEGWTRIAGGEQCFSTSAAFGGIPRKKGWQTMEHLLSALESKNDPLHPPPPPTWGSQSDPYGAIAHGKELGNEKTGMETIFKVGEGGFILREKGGKKYSYNPPRGNLILTDRRLVFAKSSVGLGKRMLVGAVAGVVLGSYVWKDMDKVNPEEIDKSLELSESFAIPLSDIVDAKAERGIKGLTNSKLNVNYKSSDKTTSCIFIVAGGLLGSEPPNDWVEAVNSAKNWYKAVNSAKKT